MCFVVSTHVETRMLYFGTALLGSQACRYGKIVENDNTIKK